MHNWSHMNEKYHKNRIVEVSLGVPCFKAPGMYSYACRSWEHVQQTGSPTAQCLASTNEGECVHTLGRNSGCNIGSAVSWMPQPWSRTRQPLLCRRRKRKPPAVEAVFQHRCSNQRVFSVGIAANLIVLGFQTSGNNTTTSASYDIVPC